MKLHPDTLAFFDELQYHNNREWFNDNKARFTAIQSQFLFFTQALIDIMVVEDTNLGHLQAKQCVYRIYRDLRFSPDKRPYKTHIACFLPIGGDRTQCVPGYYLQVGQADYDLHQGGSLGGGIFMPSPRQLAAIRQEIFYCPEEFKGILANSTYRRFYGEAFFTSKRLTRPPKGYPTDWPDIDLLKYHDYTTIHQVPDDILLTDALFDYVVEAFRAAVPLNRFLQRAVDCDL